MRGYIKNHKKIIALLLVSLMLFSVFGSNGIGAYAAEEPTDVATAGDAESVVDDTSVESEESAVEETTVVSTASANDAYGEISLQTRLEESGCDITLNAPDGSLPYPKEELSLFAREIKSDTEEYKKYLEETVDALEKESADEITFARFFDIEIRRNGEKVEPESPVEVKIEYDEVPDIPVGADMSIVHFTDEDETEVIEDVELNFDATEITYEQGSFSVTATVVSVPDVPAATEAGKNYALVAKCNGHVYIVQGDGSLTEVDKYTKASEAEDADITSVETNTPMLWTYVKEDSNTYLRYNAEGYDFNWTKQATRFSKGYIDPTNTKGVTTEKVVRVDPYPEHAWDEADTITIFDDTKDHCGIELDGRKHIFHVDNGEYSFIAVDEDGLKLVGGLGTSDSDLAIVNATNFYLAKVVNDIADVVNDDLPRNNMVNHIDISVSDDVETDISLAYGTYYDATGRPILTIDKNSSEAERKTTVKSTVTVQQENLRKAEIETTCNGQPIDDVFCITGYSSNQPSGYSGTQVRIEGRFKVANLPTYPYANPDEAKAARLKPENQIRYKITAVQPNVEFTYTHPNDPDQILYDSKGKPITVCGDVSISADFGYWDEDNKCPPIQKDWGDDQIEYNNWRSGVIAIHGGSGMDFELTGDSHVELNPVAIEITKSVEDEDGNPIIPKEDMDPVSFSVYENAGGHSDDVIDLNVGSYKGDEADYKGYVETNNDRITITSDENDNAKGIVFDYDITQGMVYVSEDKDSIPKSFEDKNGDIWVFKGTQIETEYVWRQDGDEGKKHFSKVYTLDDDEFASMPEVLGSFGEDLFNGFLEFDVHNIYEKFEHPQKQEVAPYEGTGVLGGVQVGDEITYEINYKNYKGDKADIVIKDELDPNVEFVEASDGGAESNGVVTWTLKDVPAGTEGKVTLKVKVLEGALESNGGPAKVVNGGDTATVKVGEDNEYTLNEVENPVPERPNKKEIAPYEGIGELGGVKVGDEIEYEISYKNYKADKADIVIKDELDPNVEFVEASDGGAESNGVVTWTLKDVPAGTEGKVTLKVKVLEGALESKGGPAKVVNGGDTATVKVGGDNEYTLNEVENPVPENPNKKEIAPYEGNGKLGGVKVGDEIEYEISYKNYKADKADIVIKDELDPNVEFVEASDGGAESNGVVTWTLKDVPAGTEGKVTLKVKVLEGALESKGGPGKVVNGGDTATVKVGEDNAYKLNEVENPVPEKPNKKEISPYEGNGVLGGVKVGDEIEYEISYKNYKSDKADIVIKDKLDKNVEFVEASDGGSESNGVVTWTLKDVAAGTEGKVTLKVKVLEGALESKGGPGKVVNGGDTATVKVGEDNEYTLNEVENPVPEKPNKKEISPYEGNGELGGVKVGDEITYEISYKNYKSDKADIVIKDKLDANVEFVEASDGGSESNGVVTWTLKDVAAGTEGKVTLKVKVLEGALESNGGPAKVVNGGDTATVKVGEDHEYTLNEVENPVPEKPNKKEISPYEGIGVLGGVKVGDEITYEISYKNYKSDKADIVIKDKLDKNVEFVEASDNGAESSGVVTWTLKDVAAGTEGKVTLKVKVLEGALESNGGPAKVVNGGDTATVKVGEDHEYTLNEVENPVPEKPNKKEIAPYEGIGELGGVKVGDEITYEISYKNYKSDKADIVIKDKLDANVEFVETSDGGSESNGVVTWTLKDVPAGTEGKVTLKVKVLEGALESKGGPAKVVNGGDTATVKVGEDNEYTLNEVENPVPEKPNKKEVKPYKGTGTLGEVSIGEEITYEISYNNYKSDKADIVIKDKLDANVEFVSASDKGKCSDGVVTWTLKNVAAGEEGVVTLTVKVLEGALESKGGLGKVVNGGDTATVQVGNDNAYSLNVVENPVPEPEKPEPPKPEPPKPDTPSKSKTSTPTKTSTPQKSVGVKTGDTVPMVLIMLVMIISIIGIVSVRIFRRRGNRR